MEEAAPIGDKGNWRFRSPEQFYQSGIFVNSDAFSFCAIMLYMLEKIYETFTELTHCYGNDEGILKERLTWLLEKIKKLKSPDSLLMDLFEVIMKGLNYNP